MTTDLQIDRIGSQQVVGDMLDGGASSRDPRAAFEIRRALMVNAIQSADQPPTYPESDHAVSTLQKDAVSGGAAAAEGPAAAATATAEATAATATAEATATRAIGDVAVAPVVSAEAAAEADRRARRQRMIEKAALAPAALDEGRRDCALRFDGGSYLEVPGTRPVITEGVVGVAPTITLAAGFTVEAWICPEGQIGGLRAIVARWTQGPDDGLLLGLEADGRLTVAWHLEGANAWGTPGWSLCTSAEAVRLDAWAHVAVIRDGDGIRLYLDGRRLASAEGLGAAPLHSASNSTSTPPSPPASSARSEARTSPRSRPTPSRRRRRSPPTGSTSTPPRRSTAATAGDWSVSAATSSGRPSPTTLSRRPPTAGCGSTSRRPGAGAPPSRR